MAAVVFDQLRDLPADAKVLEIGCGDGGLWKRNLDRLPAGWRIVMYDLSTGMLIAARAALPATQFRAFVQGDAERLPSHA
jgi:ubiquinone/menaquinone biosynthesis C-methylase UbiE